MANWTLPGDDEEEPQTEASDEEDCETSPENEYFTELYDTVYAALEQGSRTEALPTTAAASYAFQAPSMTIAEAIEQGITVAGAGGNLQMAKLADRARLTHTARLVLSYVIEQKLSSRAGRALFTLLKRKDFILSELSRVDVRSMNKQLTAAYESSSCPTRKVDLTRPAEDGKQSLVFYFKNIIDCIAEICDSKVLADHMSFVPDPDAELLQSGERVHGLFKNCLWWRQTMAVVGPDFQLVPVILYSDKSFFKNVSAYPIYVTIGNVDDHVRQRAGAFRMCGLIPIYNKGKSTTKCAKSHARRVLEIHHQCLEHLAFGLKEASTKGVHLRFAGAGADAPTVRLCKPILAMMLGDLPEQWSNAAQLHNGCTMCKIPKSELSRSNRTWDFKSIGEVKKSLEQAMFEGVYPGWDDGVKLAKQQGRKRRAAAEVPRPLYDLEKRTWRISDRDKAETALQYHIRPNATTGFLHFDVCRQSPFDFMHGMPLGNHPHIFRACVWDVLSSCCGSSGQVMSHSKALEDIFGTHGLLQRIEELIPARTGLRFSSFVKETVLKMAREAIGGRQVSGVQAKEQDMLVLAIPFLFGSVASDFVRTNKLDRDPSSKIQKVYIEFIEYYTLARRETLKESELKKLHRLGLELQETLKAELPERRRPSERAQAARAANAAEWDTDEAGGESSATAQSDTQGRRRAWVPQERQGGEASHRAHFQYQICRFFVIY